MLKTLSIFATVSFLLMSNATAQSAVGACAADIKKVCGDIKPGGSRIATCLKERVADLSDACKTRLADVAAARKTCNGEIEKQQCGTKSRIRKVTCIKGALSNLGDECKAAIAAVVTSKK
jgi:Cysteine rich repeat